MPHNVLISKIRCGNPNKKSTAIHNKNSFLYIGTREGTDLTPLEEENTEKFEKEMAKPDDYVRYIAKRPHSHGLFGNIPLDDIDEVSKNLYKLSRQKRLIYRGIVSLDPRDAEDLGYYDKSKWDAYIRSVIPDIADKFGISIENLQWTAAYHAEAKHPHAHYMFWSSKPMVHDCFITEYTQNKCRELLSGKMFEDERQNEILSKEAAKNYILDFGKILLPDEIKRISSITSGIIHEKTNIPKITGEQLSRTTEELIRLIPMLPKSGQLKYAFMPPDVKEQINKVVDSVLKNKTVFQEYQKFMSSVEKMAKTYSPSKKELEHAVWEDNSEEDLRVDLGNIVLKNIKKELKTHSNFSQYVETILKQLAESQQGLIDSHLEKLPTADITVTEDISNDNFIGIHNEINSSNFDTLDHDPKEEIDSPDFSSSLQSDEINDKTDSDGSMLLYEDSPSSFVGNNNYYIEWDITYKAALNELHKTHNYEKAIELLNISDIDKAIEYFKDSAELGNQFAQYQLGKIFSSPQFGMPDYPLAISFLEASAAQENDFAMYQLGILYKNSDLEFYDIDKALDYFKSSAELENQFAQYQLGKIYSSTDFGEANYPLAISYLEASAVQGNDFALYQLGVIYKNSDLEFYDIDKAIDYFKSSAELENQFAQYQLGKIYSSAAFGEPDYPLAISYLEASATQGNDFALYQLGEIYKNSDLEFYDIDKAIDYFKSSAELENQFAQYQLGKIYSSFDFGEPDYPLAISYLEASATQGNDFAMYQLGEIYKNSDLKFYDIDKAIDYFKSSAELENQFAQYQLGKIYNSPDFGIIDYSLAISYLNNSAAQGNDFAMYQLGKIYSNKDIPIYNMDLAISYLIESGNKNNSFAHLQLGIIYLWGKGVKCDVALGMDYLNKAINNGNPFAQQILDSYEIYRLQYAMNFSYKLFTNIFNAITKENDHNSTIAADRYFRNLSKKAMIEAQLKNPHKHNQEPDK